MQNMRRLLKTPTLRMQAGGDYQVPTGPGMDRAGYLARNPGVIPPVAPSGPNPTDLRLQAGTQTAASAPVPGVGIPSIPEAAPQKIFRSGNSFGDAASMRQPSAPQSAQDQQAVADMFARTPDASGYKSSAFNMPTAAGVARSPMQRFAPSQSRQPDFTPLSVPTIGEEPRRPLSLRDGGMFDGIKRALGMGGAPASAPAPAPTPPLPAGFAASNYNYAGNPALARREKEAGLRDGGDLRTGDGGHVPGSGSGDKIPAKYEPGEFVVSNAMLDAEPGLREQLHDLRGNVLAQKGMTPEQADAKAVSGGGLRAEGGGAYPNFVMPDAVPQWRQPLGIGGQMPGTAVISSTKPNFTMPRGAADEVLGSGPASRGFDTSGATDAAPRAARPAPENLRSMTTKELFSQPASGIPNNPNGPMKFAPPTPSAATPAHAAAAPGQGWAMAKDIGKSLAYGAAGYGAARSMAGIGKDNTPGTNIETRDIVNAIPTGGNMPAPGAQPYSFWKDTELGRNIGNTMNAVGPAIGAVGGLLRAGTTSARLANTGAAVAGGMGAGAAAPVEAGAPSSGLRPNATPVAAAAPAYTAPAGPRAGDVRGVDWEGVLKPEGTQDQFDGKVWRSVSTAEGKAARGLRDQEYKQQLATDAATSRADLARQLAYFEKANGSGAGGDLMSRIGQLGGKTAVNALLQHEQNTNTLRGHQMQNDVTMRGQDVTRDDNIRTNDTSLRNNKMTNDFNRGKFEVEQGNWKKTHQLAADNAAFTQGQAQQKETSDRIAGFLPPVLVDGKPTKDLAGAAQHMVGLNAALASRMGELKQHLKLRPGDKQAQNELDDISKNSAGSMDDATIQNYMTGMAARKAINDNSTGFLVPWGASAVDTQAPVTSLRRRPGTGGNDYIDQVGAVVPGRHIEKTGSILGIGGVPNKKYAELIKRGDEIAASEARVNTPRK